MPSQGHQSDLAVVGSMGGWGRVVLLVGCAKRECAVQTGNLCRKRHDRSWRWRSSSRRAVGASIVTGQLREKRCFAEKGSVVRGEMANKTSRIFYDWLAFCN